MHTRRITPGGTLETTLRVLRRRAAEMREIGIRHAGVFGSVARGEDTNSSDVDIAIEIDYSTNFGTLDLIMLEERLEEELGRPVDVVSVGGLNKHRHKTIFDELVVAF